MKIMRVYYTVLVARGIRAADRLIAAVGGLYIKDGGSPDSLSAKTILGEMFDALRDGIRTARL